METDTVTLPEYWASALINGDFSGLDVGEAERCRGAVATLAAEGWSFVGCEDEGRFTWHYALYDVGADCKGGSVLEYTIARPCS
jgi:hypothetical protein